MGLLRMHIHILRGVREIERRAGSGECGRRRVERVSISDDFFIDISVNLLYKGRWHDRSCVMRKDWGEAREQGEWDSRRWVSGAR